MGFDIRKNTIIFAKFILKIRLQKTATGFEEMLKNTSSSADLVAKVVLSAVTNENWSIRYLAGKDVETWLDSKRNMSDEEFYKMMKQNLMK